MFYFIPAWYQKERPWYHTSSPWYREGKEVFDDTISHLRMFQTNQQSNRLIVLSYKPQLRYFLHGYDLLEVDSWSLFDTIQGIRVSQQRQLDVRELDWPEGTEWLYTPFALLAYLQGRQLACVEFGTAGQLLWVDWFQKEQVEKRYIFDDRGFVSSILYYNEGRPYVQDYLDARGNCQFREYLSLNNRIEICEGASYPFQKSQYDSMELLVEEVLATYLQKQEEGATILLAAHPQHNELIHRLKGDRQLVLSLHTAREESFSSLSDVVTYSNLVVVDRLAVKQELVQEFGIETEHMPLFDTRLSLGKSQRLKEQIIYFLVDNLEQDVLLEYLSILFDAMKDLSDLVLHLVSYQGDQVARKALEERVEKILANQQAADLFLKKETIPKVVFFEPLEEEEVTSRIAMLYPESELEIVKALEQTRLVVDLADELDSYTQMAAISAGIPQVNAQQSEFVEHLKNGFYIQEPKDLRAAIEYYLVGLGNWNRALVDAVQKIEEYSSGRLAQRLINKINEHGRK